MSWETDGLTERRIQEADDAEEADRKASQVHKDDPRAHRRPGPIEEYYRGLRPEVGRAAIITEAELAALEARAAEADARYEAERWAEKRLDIAARVFTGLMTVPYDMNLPSPDYVERFAQASLDAADALLARWKETTPTTEDRVKEAIVKCGVAAGGGRVEPVAPEGGEA